MATDEVAQAAIAALNNCQMLGRALTVNETRARTRAGGGGGGAGTGWLRQASAGPGVAPADSGRTMRAGPERARPLTEMEAILLSPPSPRRNRPPRLP